MSELPAPRVGNYQSRHQPGVWYGRVVVETPDGHLVHDLGSCCPEVSLNRRRKTFNRPDAPLCPLHPDEPNLAYTIGGGYGCDHHPSETAGLS